MATETLRFDLLANDRASNVFDKVGKSAGDTESRFAKVGKGLAAVGRVAATGLAIGVGAGAIALSKMAGEARESERVGRLTESIIKSTGGAAKVTAAQVGALSTSISNKTGVDDEAIQSGSNLLLTFKNVRNEVGKGNKIFNEATQAAVDLSAAGFGSIEGSSKMLGKALNDPIAGISALGRAGVTFTAQQKEQIAAMVESGNVLGAQNVILGEVQSQVGGAAAATGTATDKMKVSIGNLGEAIGTALLPTIDKVSAGVAKFVGGLSTAFTSGGLGGAIDFVQQRIGAALPSIQAKLGEWANAFWQWIQRATPPMLAKLGQLASSLASWLGGTALPWLAAALVRWGKAFVEWVGPMIPPALQALGAGVSRLFAWLLDSGLPRLLSNLRQWGRAFVEWVGPMIPPALAELAKLGGRIIAWVVTDALPRLAGALARLGLELFQWIAPMVPRALAALAVLGARLVGWVVSEGIPDLASRMGQMGMRVVDSLRDGLVNGAGAVMSWLGGLPSRMVSAIGNLGGLLVSAGASLIQGLVNGIMSKLSAITNAMSAVASKIKGFLPGSPVKEGPLKVLNRGYAGGMIATMIADGIADNRGRVAGAMASLGGTVAADVVGTSRGLVSAGAAAATATPGSVTYNIYDATDPNRVVAAIQQYEKRNGARWRS